MLCKSKKSFQQQQQQGRKKGKKKELDEDPLGSVASQQGRVIVSQLVKHGWSYRRERGGLKRCLIRPSFARPPISRDTRQPQWASCLALRIHGDSFLGLLLLYMHNFFPHIPPEKEKKNK